MMTDMAVELKEHNIAAISLWPGLVKTETMQDIMEGKYGERLASMVCVIFNLFQSYNMFIRIVIIVIITNHIRNFLPVIQYL